MGDNKISEAARFTKRPVTIEAMQFDGSTRSASAICQWVNAGDDEAGHEDPTVSYITKDGEDSAHDMIVWTLEGDMRASPGDWIIKGVKGEFYPCKPDIFEMTYSPHLQGEAVPVGHVRRDSSVAHMIVNLPEGTPLFDHPQPAELSDVFNEALAVGDGTVNGAVVYWHQRALAAEAKLSEVGGDCGEIGMKDVVRQALTFVLWHHQGGASPVGQPIRELLGMSVHEQMSQEQVDSSRAMLAALAATGKQQGGEVQGDGRSPNEMADALERIAGGALSDYEGVEADELHILRCAKLIRDLSSRQPVGDEGKEE